MTRGDEREVVQDQLGWRRDLWLAEKIQSGELPAPADDALRECDRIFVDDGDLDAHVAVIAETLLDMPSDAGGAAPVGGAAARGRRTLRAYLQRLLQVREMWARERS